MGGGSVLEYIETGKMGNFVASIDVRQLRSQLKNVSCLENLDISHLS